MQKLFFSTIKTNLLTKASSLTKSQEFIWSSKFSPLNPKINYLQKLLQNNSINNYFQEKPVQQLDAEDIYFYLSNRELFHRLPVAAKKQLINNPKVDITFKFHLSSELNILENNNTQKNLISSFNECILQMTQIQIAFCLQKVCQFQSSIQRLNTHAIQQRLGSCADNEIFLKIVYSLTKLGFRVSQALQTIMNKKLNQIDNPSIKTILYLKKISEFYKMNLSQYIQKKMHNKIKDNTLQIQQDEVQDMIKLLQFYPQFANTVDLQHFTEEDYIDYLDFFLVNKNVTPVHHRIPTLLISKFQTHDFLHVLQKRVSLQLDTPSSIIKFFKFSFCQNLNGVVAIIRFFHQQQIKDNEIWLQIQQVLIQKIIRHDISIFQKYSIADVCKTLGYLSVNNYGSIPFWKKSLKIVQQAFGDGKYFKFLTGQQQKKFVVYLYQIFKNKPLIQSLQQKIIDLTLLSLMLNKWKLKQILPLTISLTSNRLGDHELWFAIQKKIQQNRLSHIENQGQRKTLKKIVINFNTMNKGSFSFWHDMTIALNQNQKKQILSHFKKENSMAHIYFTNNPTL